MLAKNYNNLLFFISLASNTVISVPLTEICGVPVSLHSDKSVSLGYDNCDMYTNGENFIVSHIIKPHHLVFDVGSNSGRWSLMALKKNQPISLYAFEPISEVFEHLKKNLSATSAKAYNLALSDSNGTKIFYQYKNSELSSFYRRDEKVEAGIGFPIQISVSTKTISSICHENNINHINFLKIDTEGGELDVLMGASNLLETQSIDVIQFEYGGTYKDAGINLKQVCILLTTFDYKIFRIIKNGLIYISEWDDVLENYRYSNYLAISSPFLREETIWQEN